MSGVRESANLSGSNTPADVAPGHESRLAFARARWLEVQDELLRGVTHAMSNRVATVSAAAYMLEHNDVTPGQAAASLRDETDRMDSLLQMLRMLPAREDDGVEPLLVADVLSDALALHSHHCDLRDVAVRVSVADDVMPVLAEPHALLQALLLALTSAKRAAYANMLGVSVSVSGDAEKVFVRVHPDEGAVSVDTALSGINASAADALLFSVGGAAGMRLDGGCDIELPTLRAARRAGR